MSRLFVLLLISAGTLSAVSDDPYCPAYPKSQRTAAEVRLSLERSAAVFSRDAAKDGTLRMVGHPIRNLIDDHIFGKMQADGVAPAPIARDEEILRRLYLDLTGRIPTLDQAAGFIGDESPAKRSALIDQLMAGESFVDYWTFFYANHFEVTSRYYQYINTVGRNLFHQHLRAFIASSRSYKDFASELITGKGDTYQNGPVNFIVRGYQPGDPIQDTFDTLTDRITTKFLGVQTQCVSCHDGRNHLEQINLYLTGRKREEFWRQSAFVSRTSWQFLSEYEGTAALRTIVTDRNVGAYNGNVPSSNPGPRPARLSGPFTPQYFFSGGGPQSPDWRAELARELTSDRQFAKAAVNYIWAHFFRFGIVDPPDAWDLARVDPANPPPEPWALQASHPALLEALADEFIGSGYNIRHIIRLIADSNSYQLSSRYEGNWRPHYQMYFAKHFPRRLTAEEVFDALTSATRTPVPMQVEGFARPLYYAVQLPDPTEPRSNGTIINFLTLFGRGDWWTVPRSSESNVLQVLYQMNDSQFVARTAGNRNQPTFVSRILQTGMSDSDAIQHLFLATLARYPTGPEIDLTLKKRTTNAEQWLSDLQWALLNKAEFVFSQ